MMHKHKLIWVFLALTCALHTRARLHRKKTQQSIKVQTKKIIEPVAIETICSADGDKEGKLQPWSDGTRETGAPRHMHAHLRGCRNGAVDIETLSSDSLYTHTRSQREFSVNAMSILSPPARRRLMQRIYCQKLLQK